MLSSQLKLNLSYYSDLYDMIVQKIYSKKNQGIGRFFFYI